MIFGRNEFAARLPSYILSLGTLYILYCLNKELINKKVAKLSALILSTSLFGWANRLMHVLGDPIRPEVVE